MKKSFLHFTILLSTILIFASLSIKAQVIGNRQVKEETREITGTFQTIKSIGSVDIILKQGSETSVIVRADANIIPYISTTLENSVLTVSTKRNISYAKVMEVYVTAPDISQISASGSGDILCKPVFKAPELKITASGSGDVSANLESENVILKVMGSGDITVNGIHGKLQLIVSGSGDVVADRLQLLNCSIKSMGSGDISIKGKTTALAIVASGSGDIDASQFTAISVKSSQLGSGDISVHPVEKLDAALTGSGDLTYYGNPAILKARSTGSGDIRKR